MRDEPEITTRTKTARFWRDAQKTKIQCGTWWSWLVLRGEPLQPRPGHQSPRCCSGEGPSACPSSYNPRPWRRTRLGAGRTENRLRCLQTRARTHPGRRLKTNPGKFPANDPNIGNKNGCFLGMFSCYHERWSGRRQWSPTESPWEPCGCCGCALREYGGYTGERRMWWFGGIS